MGQKVSTWVSIGLAAWCLAGCAQVTPIATTVPMPGMPNAEFALQRSMSDVGVEMARIGKIGPEVVASDRPIVVPGELDRRVSFQWNGSLDDAVRELGKVVGYTVEIRGASIFMPRVQVSIDPAPRRVFDLFIILGEQAGSQAVVRLDSRHHVVEVVYRG
ncbi:DotD/TraH family lipoprotein [uncultured Rhodoblastus sp.]|uniref:DotD/TraH family lipoprotein n=1 Tax=uncultured Rhodoblastus sp. TaxID=543037 RepID=UPI0025CD3346|nr:DotD/TraH family lipoprotein [uncultured Rhodoblastus sp.]